MWLTILLTCTGGNNTPGLSLNVWEVTLVIDDDMTCLTGGLWSYDALVGNDLTDEGGLVLMCIDLDVGMVVVGSVLKECLL